MYVLCLPCGRKILMAQKNVLPFEISLILILFDIISDRFYVFLVVYFYHFFFKQRKNLFRFEKKAGKQTVKCRSERKSNCFTLFEMPDSQKYRYRISLHTVQLFFYNLQFCSSVTACIDSGLWTVWFLYK